MLKLNITYYKKLGLPQYSSHSASASLEVELTDVQQAPGEIIRHYTMLQTALDQQLMQQPGFVPDATYASGSSNNLANSSSAHHGLPSQSEAAQPNRNTEGTSSTWLCTAKQHLLIGDLARRLDLTDQQLNERAQRLACKPVHQLSKQEASDLISGMISEAGPKRTQNSNGPEGNSQPVPTNGSARDSR